MDPHLHGRCFILQTLDDSLLNDAKVQPRSLVKLRAHRYDIATNSWQRNVLPFSWQSIRRMTMINRINLLAGIALLITGFGVTPAYADNSWGGYHWARSANPLHLTVIDSMTSDWDTELDVALYGDGVKYGWDTSVVLALTLEAGNDSNRTRKRCKSQPGQIRVCNATYGANGWLGLASIGLDSQGHIVQGTAKMNDTYSSYWAIAGEKQHVVCQEIGHLFGLGHTSEDRSSQQTCMDYSQDPQSQWPNDHDLDQLLSIYNNHVDNDTTTSGGDEGGGGGCNAPAGKGCNKSGIGTSNGEIPPMGVRVHGNNKYELWVAPRKAGGLWIHHIRLAEGEHKH